MHCFLALLERGVFVHFEGKVPKVRKALDSVSIVALARSVRK